MLGVSNSKLVHAGLEGGPAEGGLVLAEKRERLQLVGAGGAVGEKEADAEVLRLEVVAATRSNQLKGHGGGIVADAVKLWRSSGQLGEAEKGHESAVSAKLEVEARGAGFFLSESLEGLGDLAGEDGAGDGADGLASVVGEVPFVDGGEVVETIEGGFGEEFLGGDGGVVDGGDVDVVEDCFC